MKKALFRTLFIICALAAAVTAAASQETRFSVEILGTSRFEDIAVIHDGLRRSDGVLDLRVVRSSRNYVKLEGDISLLQRLIDGEWRDSECLIVPPGHRVVPSFGDDVIRAVSASASDSDTEEGGAPAEN